MKLLIAALLAAAPARAKTNDGFKMIGQAKLAAELASANPPQVYDANTPETREHVGVIPGAHLLDSSSRYDADKTLPADKSSALVFYCANRMCTASHDAARRALAAGYKNVSVMYDGIFGWRKAGRPLAPAPGRAAQIAPKAAAALVAEHGAVIVDVREGEERFETVPGARSMPMSRAEDPKAWSAFVAALPKNDTIVFYCASGVRAKAASERLAAQGYSTAFFKNTDQWKAAGLPVEPGPAR